jgi:hypothetical protein
LVFCHHAGGHRDASLVLEGRIMSKPKISTRHPYCAIEHRVVDSPAYASLTFSARSLLTLLTRQLTKDNNGHLQASFTWCKKFGFGSEHTLRDAIADLIAHGFIYRTRSHGANGAWARYAVTWLPITRREGLFLGGFVACAWRDFEASGKKTSRQKVLEASGRKCSFIPKHPAENAGITPAKSAEYESIPCRGVVSPSCRGSSPLSPWRKFRLTSRRVEISLPHPHQPGKNQATASETADGCTRIRDGEMLAACWDAGLGEFVAPPPRQNRHTVLFC